MPFLYLQPSGGAFTRPQAHKTAAAISAAERQSGRGDRRRRRPSPALLRRVMFGLAIAAACFGAAQARSPYVRTDADGVPVVKVVYNDLDLSVEQGARTMLARISTAAKIVCGPAPATVMMDRTAYWRTCIHAAEADAVKRLGGGQGGRALRRTARDEALRRPLTCPTRRPAQSSFCIGLDSVPELGACRGE